MTIAWLRRTGFAAAALAALALLAVLGRPGAAPAASAPSLAIAPACQQPGSAVHVNAAGFTPGKMLALSLDGDPTGAEDSTTTDAAGHVSFRVIAPELPAGAIAVPHSLAANDGTLGARATFAVTKFGAFYRPLGGRPGRAVRISLAGWGAGRTVYLHFVHAGSSRPRKTVRVAPVGGLCGSGRARLRHLYPFSPQRGAWRLQFDTQRVYSPRNRPQFTYLSTVN